jgi:hypothetical protein
MGKMAYSGELGSQDAVSRGSRRRHSMLLWAAGRIQAEEDSCWPGDPTATTEEKRALQRDQQKLRGGGRADKEKDKYTPGGSGGRAGVPRGRMTEPELRRLATAQSAAAAAPAAAGWVVPRVHLACRWCVCAGRLARPHRTVASTPEKAGGNRAPVLMKVMGVMSGTRRNGVTRKYMHAVQSETRAGWPDIARE